MHNGVMIEIIMFHDLSRLHRCIIGTDSGIICQIYRQPGQQQKQQTSEKYLHTGAALQPGGKAGIPCSLLFSRCLRRSVPGSKVDAPPRFQEIPEGTPALPSTAKYFRCSLPSTGCFPQMPDLFLFLQKIQTDIPEHSAIQRLCVWEEFSFPAYYNPLRT